MPLIGVREFSRNPRQSSECVANSAGMSLSMNAWKMLSMWARIAARSASVPNVVCAEAAGVISARHSPAAARVRAIKSLRSDNIEYRYRRSTERKRTRAVRGYTGTSGTRGPGTNCRLPTFSIGSQNPVERVGERRSFQVLAYPARPRTAYRSTASVAVERCGGTASARASRPDTSSSPRRRRRSRR